MEVRLALAGLVAVAHMQILQPKSQLPVLAEMLLSAVTEVVQVVVVVVVQVELVLHAVLQAMHHLVELESVIR